jgi:hypothetical protein
MKFVKRHRTGGDEGLHAQCVFKILEIQNLMKNLKLLVGSKTFNAVPDKLFIHDWIG